MNTLLSKEQAEKGDKLLEKIISEGSLDNETVYSFFNDRDEAIYICNHLENQKLIYFIGATERDPFMVVDIEDGVSTFLKNGGLSLIAKNQEREINDQKERQLKENELLDLDIRLKKFESKIGKKIILAGFIITILSFLISILTQNLF